MKVNINPLDAETRRNIISRFHTVFFTVAVIYVLITTFLSFRWYVEHKNTLSNLWVVRAEKTIVVPHDAEIEVVETK